jgi:hypothetical protein
VELAVMVMRDTQVWDFVFGPAAGSPPRRVASDADAQPATLGIVWVDSGCPMRYEFVVNGTPLGPPRVASGGRLVLQVGLRPGLNRLAWSIQHTSVGWRRAIYLRVNDKVTKLSEDQDPDHDIVARSGAARVRIPL